jgi:putative PIN family toxin of toxin-antitoxin system
VRVVLDTNVLISALLSEQGAPARLLDAWEEQRFHLVSSEEQLQEFKAVCRREHLAPYIERGDAGRVINQIRAEALILGKLPPVERSKDPADNFLLAMAEAGEADFLVSGDRRGVLGLGQHGRTQIVTAQTMAPRFGLVSNQTRPHVKK